VSWTLVLSSPALAEVNVNNSPPAGISSLNVTLSETLADVALEANIAALSAMWIGVVGHLKWKETHPWHGSEPATAGP